MKRRSQLKWLSTMGLAASLPAGVRAASDDAAPGDRFARVDPPQAARTPGKIEVLDVFWFGCPHCYRFLPVMEAFEADLPGYVSVRRMPAIFRSSWEPHARAYYAAQLLGVERRIHRPLFEEIHEQGRKLDSKSTLGEFFSSHGVSQSDFDEAYGAFSVDSRVHEATVLQQSYGITGTPTVVVHGKYRVTAAAAGGYQAMIDVVRNLAEREHDAR